MNSKKNFILKPVNFECQIKDEESRRVRKAVIYVCLGIDMEGKKAIFGYYIFYGSENREKWLQILNTEA